MFIGLLAPVCNDADTSEYGGQSSVFFFFYVPRGPSLGPSFAPSRPSHGGTGISDSFGHWGFRLSNHLIICTARASPLISD